MKKDVLGFFYSNGSGYSVLRLSVSLITKQTVLLVTAGDSCPMERKLSKENFNDNFLLSLSFVLTTIVFRIQMYRN